MAFCNSCGATVEPAAKFCPKCGKPVPVTAATPVAVAPPAKSSSGLKIVLIVLAVVVALGILGSMAVGFFAWRVARSTHVEEKNGNVKVQTPFGTVESTDNPDAAARNLGVALYPGAKVLKGNAADVNFGGVHSTAAQFETDDPVDKVAEFYKAEFPNATVSAADDKHYAIVATADKSVITITIEPEDGKTMIHIANVTGKGTGGSD
jgi:flagellar basal body-associated protein FliL